MSNDQQNRIAELEKEIHDLYDDIENLQDEIMKKDSIILELSESGGSKKGAQKALKKQLTIEMEEKDREIRDLKNKMGFLRKEKMDLERELKKFTDKRTSTVITIEEKKTPLKSLVDELQIKIKKLRAENSALKKQMDSGISPEIEQSLNEKDDEINMLKKKVSDLTKKFGSQAISPLNKKTTQISSDLTSELQNKLNKAKLQIESLKQQLQESAKKEKKLKPEKDKKQAKPEKDLQVEKLKQQVEDLKSQLELKTMSEEASKSGSSTPFSDLSAELQEKLNAARRQIKNLQNQIKTYEGAAGSSLPVSSSFQQQKMEEDLRRQNEEITLLNQKIKEQEHILSVKEERIISLTEKLKMPTLNANLKNMDENTPFALRVRELSKMVEELKKQNVQQRLEISELRRI
ncbi:MAG: hypothetical protein ACFFBP_03155 [Promethearchaeota archaeon]